VAFVTPARDDWVALRQVERPSNYSFVALQIECVGIRRCISIRVVGQRSDGHAPRSCCAVATRFPPLHQLAIHSFDECHGPRARLDVPDDTAAALRLLKVLVECRQMDPSDAEEWRRRIEGWARFNVVGRLRG